MVTYIYLLPHNLKNKGKRNLAKQKYLAILLPEIHAFQEQQSVAGVCIVMLFIKLKGKLQERSYEKFKVRPSNKQYRLINSSLLCLQCNRYPFVFELKKIGFPN